MYQLIFCIVQNSSKNLFVWKKNKYLNNTLSWKRCSNSDSTQTIWIAYEIMFRKYEIVFRRTVFQSEHVILKILWNPQNPSNQTITKWQNSTIHSLGYTYTTAISVSEAHWRSLKHSARLSSYQFRKRITIIDNSTLILE